MKFGFDIDDTLINLREHAFHLYNKKLNRNVPIQAFHELKKVFIHEPFGLTDEQGKEMWNNSLNEIYYTHCPPYPMAVETLQNLVNQGHKIYYITARPKEHGERTREWMKKNGFPVQNERFFYGMEDHEKAAIIQTLKLDYYFDDKPEILETILNESTKVFLKDQSYNRHKDLPRIADWNELIAIIKNEQK